jgi:probable F420-dependent oxidoreductase
MTMRLGLAVPFVYSFPAEQTVPLLREVESRGYHTAWIGEVAGGDAVTVMALVASHTTRLSTATGVIPVQTRTPVLLGLTVATLGRLAPGRVALGLGLSSPVVVEQWNGVPFASRLGVLREAVHVIRAVASGERVTFEGRFYRVRGFRMSAPPPPQPVKIYLAALGPKALELAGEIADGVLLNWLGPETVPAAIRGLEAGAKRAGRTLDGFEIAAFVRTCVTDDPEAARRWLARDITGYATVDAYANFFRSSGFAAEIDALQAAWHAGDRAGAVTHITPRVLDALGVVGPEASCRARMQEFVAAGLTMPVVVPFTPEGGGAEAQASILRTVRTFP